MSVEQKNVDAIKLIQWIFGGLLVGIAFILLNGILSGAKTSELSDIWSVILFTIAGIFLLPLNIKISERKISSTIRFVLVGIFIFLAIMLI